MKRIIFLFFALTIAHGLFAQDRVVDSVVIKASQLDSLDHLLLYRISQHTAPVYRLYPTDNMWTFLELETTTGKIWQIQYSLESEKRLKLPLNSYNYASYSDILDERDNEEFAGRFELIKTQNMYNFLLLDTLSGRIWQIQWSMNADNRGVVGRIYEQ